jgi:DNA-binding NarL/FixJ family response regulator
VSRSQLDLPEGSPLAGRPDDHDARPGSAAGPSPTPVSSAGRPDGLPPPGSRVLVVDDAVSIRTEIRLLLEEAGLNVVGEGSHGAEGVTLARELRPDVVVMDVRMPILDGIAATGYITRELPDTRVIVFSAFEDQDLADAARAAGASGFLTKDASPFAIAAAVRGVAPND